MGFLKDKMTRRDFITYAIVVIAFIVVQLLVSMRLIPRSIQGQLVPITAYIVMAVALNLVVGIAGDLSLGHAGFMSIGAFTGVVVTMSLAEAIPSDGIRLAIAIVVGAIFAAVMGFLIGLPVMRLQGDYLAIVTLAFGEIIKGVVSCLLVGWDEKGLHVLFNSSGSLGVDDLHLSIPVSPSSRARRAPRAWTRSRHSSPASCSSWLRSSSCRTWCAAVPVARSWLCATTASRPRAPASPS